MTEDEEKNKSVAPQMIATVILVAVTWIVGGYLAISLAGSIKGSGDPTGASMFAGVVCLFVTAFVSFKIVPIIVSSLFDED
jgi:FlaG/FlaF family flagellin (archaellin)